MMDRQLKTLLDGGRTKRMHVMDVLQQQTVGEHTYGVLAILLLIVPQEHRSGTLMAAALTHDASERDFGDVPGHAKKEPDVASAYARLEDKWARDIGFHVELTLEQKTLLEFADKLEFMAFCVRERQMGNTLVRIPYGRAQGWLENVIATAPGFEKYGFHAVAAYNTVHSWWRSAAERSD